MPTKTKRQPKVNNDTPCINLTHTVPPPVMMPLPPRAFPHIRENIHEPTQRLFLTCAVCDKGRTELNHREHTILVKDNWRDQDFQPQRVRSYPGYIAFMRLHIAYLGKEAAHV